MIFSIRTAYAARKPPHEGPEVPDPRAGAAGASICWSCASTAPRCATRSRPRSALDMLDVFSRLVADTQDYRCVVLTGAGDKAFCAGGDLKERHGMTDEQWLAQHAIFERMTLALLDCPIPVIARGERRGVRRRLRARAHLRLRLCEHDGALRADRDHARHHAGRRRHPVPAARGRARAAPRRSS